VENDDKKNGYAVNDLMLLNSRLNVPIVFDYHHFTFNTGDQTKKEALTLAVSTWPEGITPVVHYSESKALHENNDKLKPQAHSDYINDLPNTYGYDVAVMVESKKKELAILPFIKNTICEYSGLLSTQSYN
jgi:UV DNA damage endonuclease